MRDPQRQWPLILDLYVLWQHFPDMRLCQLLVNLTGRSEPFYVEDEKLRELIQSVFSGTHPYGMKIP